jgi:hypothetical protein
VKGRIVVGRPVSRIDAGYRSHRSRTGDPCFVRRRAISLVGGPSKYGLRGLRTRLAWNRHANPGVRGPAGPRGYRCPVSKRGRLSGTGLRVARCAGHQNRFGTRLLRRLEYGIKRVAQPFRGCRFESALDGRKDLSRIRTLAILGSQEFGDSRRGLAVADVAVLYGHQDILHRDRHDAILLPTPTQE